jgi:hypothetical protein
VTEALQPLAEVDELNFPVPLGDLGMLTPGPTVLLIPVVEAESRSLIESGSRVES